MTPLSKKIASHTTTKNHIIWDWNGTLLDDISHCVATINQLLTEHQLPNVSQDHYRQIFEFPISKYYRALGFDLSEQTFEKMCEKYVSLYMSGFRDCPLVQGMRETIETLRDEKKQQSVLSASDQQSLDEMIDHFSLRNFFDHVFGLNNKLAASKLDRGKELISLSRVPLDEIVLIGDTLHDLEVGQALGIDVILVGHGHQCEKRLKLVHPIVI